MVSCNFCDVDSNNQKVTEEKKTLQGLFVGEKLIDFISNHYFYDNSCNGFGMTNFLCTKMVKRSFAADGLKEGVGMWFGEDQIAMFSMLYKLNKLCVIPDRLYYYVHYKEQTTNRYNNSLWTSLIKMFEAYQRLDEKQIACSGLRQRTWLYISRTIFNKMALEGVSRNTFVTHMSEVRNHPYMNQYFKPIHIAFNYKENIKYWLLKLRLYNVFYLFVWRAKKKYNK